MPVTRRAHIQSTVSSMQNSRDRPMIWRSTRAQTGYEARAVGVVRVTAPLALGCGFLAARLTRMRDELPGLIVELVADDSNLSLTRRQADLAVRIGRPRQPGLIARRAGSVMT